MYARFKWDPEVRFDVKELDKLTTIKKPAMIFVCSTHDIMGEWIPDSWIQDIIDTCRRVEKHTYLFLTKNPERYCQFEFPANCKLGVTITGETKNSRIDFSRIDFSKIDFSRIDFSRIDFISFEPLLNRIDNPPIVDWYIIGGLTPKPVHQLSWIDDIIEAANRFEIPVFIKDNACYPIERKEWVRGWITDKEIRIKTPLWVKNKNSGN